MNCRELLAGLEDYLDGETQSALCQALRQHLAGCDPCRIVIDNIRQTIRLYRANEEIPLPQGLHEQLRAILERNWAARFPGDRAADHRPVGVGRELLSRGIGQGMRQ